MTHAANGTSMGVLCTSGAEDWQLRHLDFLGIEVGEAVREHGARPRTTWPLRFDGERFDYGRNRAGLEAKITDGLTDVSAERTAAIAAHLDHPVHRDVPRAFDPVALALLAELGISPAWLALVASLLPSVEIRMDVEREPVRPQLATYDRHDAPRERFVPVQLWLGERKYWNGGILGLMGPVPETVAACAAGRPLRQVASHPLLDGMDLVVGTMDPWNIEIDGLPAIDITETQRHQG